MTFNSGNPIGSTDARDLSDNAENMDYLENSTTELTHADRLGTVRKTRHGMEVEHDAQISAHEAEHDAQMQSFEGDFDGRLAGMAFTRVGSFAAGATLTDMRQALVWEVSQGGDGHEYGWAGSFPKVVAAGATPATSGGIGAGAWVDRSDILLRNELSSVDGDSLVGYANYSQIRAYAGDKKSIRCGGRTSIYSGDGAHGKFYRDDSDTTSADNDGTILIDALGRRWKRKYSHKISVKCFGAIADTSFDSSDAFLKSINALGYAYAKKGTYSINIDSGASAVSPFFVFGDGAKLTVLRAYNPTLPVIKYQRGTKSKFSDMTLEGASSSSYGLYLGNGSTVGIQTPHVELDNIEILNFTASCVHFNNVSYATMRNVKVYSYYGNGVSGSLFNSTIDGGSIVGGTNALNLSLSSSVNIRTDIFNETNQTNNTLVTLAGCDHINFLPGCRIEPQSKCNTAQILIDGSAKQCSDIMFDKTYWLGDLSAARGAHSIKSIGIVNRTVLNDCDMYITDTANGYYNLRIESTGEPWVLRNTYKTDAYNDSSKAAIAISNTNSTVIRRQIDGALYLGPSSATAGLFVDSSSGQTNYGQFVYSDDTWQAIVAGQGQLVITSGSTRPFEDGTKTLGGASYRWSTVYATTGTINTSDAREKTAPLAIDDVVLDAWGDVQLVTFQWLDAVRLKGTDTARWHFGVIAQQVRDAFSARGLDGTRYGLLCYDEWDASDAVFDEDGNVVQEAVEAGNRWGIRSDQCLFLEAAYQRRRCDLIEARLKAAGI